MTTAIATSIPDPIDSSVLWPERNEVDRQRRTDNASRADQKGLAACELCGRGVAEGKGWWVEVIDGGSLIAANASNHDENEPGYMGCYLLGPECGKHVPATHRVRDAV